jgi:hypothetical protein
LLEAVNQFQANNQPRSFNSFVSSLDDANSSHPVDGEVQLPNQEACCSSKLFNLRSGKGIVSGAGNSSASRIRREEERDNCCDSRIVDLIDQTAEDEVPSA